MINEVIVMGFYKEEKGYLKIQGKKYLHIIIEVDKAFMNNEGVYEKDYIECLIWKGEADRLLSLEQQCHWLSLKGRLVIFESRMYVLAEKIKYLDSQLSIQ